MIFKITYIDIGYGQKWPIELLLISLSADGELSEAEWWRRMAILQNAAAQTSDTVLLTELNKAKEKKFGSCFPQQVVTTLQNMPQSGSLEDTIYFAPLKGLQRLLSDAWFDQASANKQRFTVAWREQIVYSLMTSIYCDDIAQEWGNKDHRLQVKGHIMGALREAGVLNKSALYIARMYYGTGSENTKEVKTLARYMGDCRKDNSTEWIKDYVNNTA